jgi:hypothetical protein
MEERQIRLIYRATIPVYLHHYMIFAFVIGSCPGMYTPGMPYRIPTGQPGIFILSAGAFLVVPPGNDLRLCR